jgi:hypothetical protein
MGETRIGLVLTGQAEAEGFAVALKRLWANADVSFEVIAKDPETRVHPGFTSERIDPIRLERRARDAGGPPKVDELVQALAGALTKRRPVDYAMVIDDLELVNRGNEANVLRAFREAVERTGERRTPQMSERLRARGSIHLLDPMLEAYFFASARTLRKITAQSPRLEPGRDCERLSVDSVESEYFSEALGECSRRKGSGKPGAKERRCPWSGDPTLRREHPKKYLQYLCRGSEPEQYCTDYVETAQGSSALREIDWAEVFAHEAPYLRALIEDVEAMVGERPSLPESVWSTARTSGALTALAVHRRVLEANEAATGVLRNL